MCIRDRFVSVQQSQLEFIQKNNIKTLILSPKANLSETLTRYIDTVVVVPGWEEKIVRLKY